MIRYRFTIVLLSGLLIFSCKRENQLPNIIILLADDAGYADFGFMGSKDLETPQIDQLASKGVVFTDSHTSASVCSPSRAGLLTGRYQHRFGHEHNSPPAGMGMDTTEVTMASVLKQAGYKTALFGKWHVGEEKHNHPNQRGFDEFYGFIGGHRSYFSDKPDTTRTNRSMEHNGEYIDFEGYLTDVLGDKAIEFMDQNKDNPFFIYLSYNAVHTPMEATEGDLARFEGHHRQKLAAMTWSMDRSIGNVLNKLNELGLEENTLVFFMSDNGGPTESNTSSNEPLKSTKGLEFEGGHRIPFVFRWPAKFEGGRKFDGLSSTLDLLPTMMGAAEINRKDLSLDGVDLTPYLTGSKTREPHDQLFWRIHPWRAARVGDMKLIQAGEVGSVLYNLVDDLGETKDLKESDTTSYLNLMTKLRSWENGMREPKWVGEGKWEDVKRVMYRDLMENKEPRVSNPWELNRLIKEGKISIELAENE